MRKVIDKNEVIKLVKEGRSYDEIATILRFTKSSIGRFCRKHFGLLEDRGKSTRQKIDILDVQKEIIFGSLLGDMCLQKHSKTFRGSECHSVKQKEYLVYKHSLLKPLVGIIRDETTIINGKSYFKNAFSIRPNTNLEYFYNVFYKDFNGKKDVPFKLDLLTPRAIAFWFMDDGFLINNEHSETLGFSTCSFSLEGLLRLQEKLDKDYNIKTIIRKNFYLVIKRNSATQLSSLIKPYIIKEMQYKLGSYLGLC